MTKLVQGHQMLKPFLLWWFVRCKYYTDLHKCDVWGLRWEYVALYFSVYDEANIWNALTIVILRLPSIQYYKLSQLKKGGSIPIGSECRSQRRTARSKPKLDSRKHGQVRSRHWLNGIRNRQGEVARTRRKQRKTQRGPFGIFPDRQRTRSSLRSLRSRRSFRIIALIAPDRSRSLLRSLQIMASIAPDRSRSLLRSLQIIASIAADRGFACRRKPLQVAPPIRSIFATFRTFASSIAMKMRRKRLS